MTETLSRERTLEKGGSAMVEQLPVAKTYTPAHDSRQSDVLLGFGEGTGVGVRSGGRSD